MKFLAHALQEVDVSTLDLMLFPAFGEVASASVSKNAELQPLRDAARFVDLTSVHLLAASVAHTISRLLEFGSALYVRHHPCLKQVWCATLMRLSVSEVRTCGMRAFACGSGW